MSGLLLLCVCFFLAGVSAPLVSHTAIPQWVSIVALIVGIMLAVFLATDQWELEALREERIKALREEFRRRRRDENDEQEPS